MSRALRDMQYQERGSLTASRYNVQEAQNCHADLLLVTDAAILIHINQLFKNKQVDNETSQSWEEIDEIYD